MEDEKKTVGILVETENISVDFKIYCLPSHAKLLVIKPPGIIFFFKFFILDKGANWDLKCC